jgi:hypothetical protein
MREDLNPSGIRANAHEHAPDLVFDFLGRTAPDLGALCLMLTATIQADADDRRVWLHGLPEPAWRVLHALGLESFFSLLPQSGELVH